MPTMSPEGINKLMGTVLFNYLIDNKLKINSEAFFKQQ